MSSGSRLTALLADWAATWRPLDGAIHHACGGRADAALWTVSMVQLVDRLHNPKGYAISAVHLKSDGAGAKAQRVAREDNSRGQRHGQQRVKLGGRRCNGDTGHVTPK